MAITPTRPGVTAPGTAFVSGVPSSPPCALSDLIFQEKTVTFVGTTIAQLAPSSADRVYLAILWGSAAGTINIATKPSSLGAASGRLVNTSQPAIISWAGDGSAVNEPWYGRPTAGGTAVVQEIFYRPAELSCVLPGTAINGECR